VCAKWLHFSEWFAIRKPSAPLKESAQNDEVVSTIVVKRFAILKFSTSVRKNGVQNGSILVNGLQ